MHTTRSALSSAFRSIDAYGFFDDIMQVSWARSMEKRSALKVSGHSLGDCEKKTSCVEFCSRLEGSQRSTSFFFVSSKHRSTRRPPFSFFSVFLPQRATHPTITAIPLGGGGPEGTEEAPAGSGDADADADDFDDASRRGGGGESELARLEETIVKCCCFR